MLAQDALGNRMGRLAVHLEVVRWRSIVNVATLAAVIAYGVAVALPRHMLIGDLEREIDSLNAQTQRSSEDRRSTASSRSDEAEKGLEASAPIALLPAATAASRRAGLQLAAAKQILPQPSGKQTRRVRVQGAASFEEILGFLDEIVEVYPTLQVEALSVLRPAAPGAAVARLDFDCTLSVASPTAMLAASARTPRKAR